MQCKICKEWKIETLLYEDKTSNSHGKLCWLCLNQSPKKRKKEDNVAKDNEVPSFICFECGKTTDEMKKGDTLKYKDDGHLYCNGCASVLFASDKELVKELMPGEVKCEMCSKTIPAAHYRVILQGMLLCGECAHELREYTGDGWGAKCWICNLVIPKDHKIIDRFGVRVCEFCALPSDVIKDDTVN